MKLTPRLRLVKPTASPIVVAALATLLTMLCAAWLWYATDDSRSRIDAFGSSVAAGFAALAVDPLLKQDRMHLAVISNRMLQIDEVEGVAVFSVDNQILAASGESKHATGRGSRFTEPVTFDESIMGYVQVTLDPTNMSSPTNFVRIALALATLLVVPGLCLGLLSLRIYPRPMAAVAEVDFDPPRENVQHYLLALNLYNQIGLTTEERTRELNQARTVAQRVGNVYSASVHPLPGTGLLMHFPDTGDEDRGLQVLCAAFVVAKLLEEQTGIYRLGLHTINLPADAELPDQAQEISDVALLSALAKHMTLAVSEGFPLRLLQQDRVECHPLDHPLLDEIGTAQGRGYLITALSPAQEALVRQQVVRFSQHQDDSTANESTF